MKKENQQTKPWAKLDYEGKKRLEALLGQTLQKSQSVPGLWEYRRSWSDAAIASKLKIKENSVAHFRKAHFGHIERGPRKGRSAKPAPAAAVVGQSKVDWLERQVCKLAAEMGVDLDEDKIANGAGHAAHK